MVRVMRQVLLVALLAGCRTEPAAEVKCDAHLMPINVTDGRGSSPVARTDGQAPGARGDEH
jgi:hypothetical protein